MTLQPSIGSLFARSLVKNKEPIRTLFVLLVKTHKKLDNKNIQPQKGNQVLHVVPLHKGKRKSANLLFSKKEKVYDQGQW